MKKRFWIVLSIVTSGSYLLAQTPSFQGLGPLSSTYKSSRAFDVSADGSTVVGTVGTTSPYSNARAFYWTRNTGMTQITYAYSYANAVSANGGVITGAKDAYQPGFVWKRGGSIQNIPALPGGTNASSGRKVSDDGRYVVGISGYTSAYHSGLAFRQAVDGQIQSLGDLPGGAAYSEAFGVSSDGSVVVGWSEGSNGVEAFRWTQSQGMVGLGHMQVPGTRLSTNATAVSPNGDVILGYTHTFEGNRYAYRWTSAGGKVSLGTLSTTGYRDDTPLDLSADGSIIVGYSGSTAWIWDQGRGMRNLQTVLTNDYGLNLAGWQLTLANAISNDGQTIVGWGINPSGIEQGWIAVVPEPATLLLLGLGGLLIRKR